METCAICGSNINFFDSKETIAKYSHFRACYKCINNGYKEKIKEVLFKNEFDINCIDIRILKQDLNGGEFFYETVKAIKDDLTKSEISKFIDFCKNDYSMQNAIKVISTPENFYRRLEKVNNRIISDNCSMGINSVFIGRGEQTNSGFEFYSAKVENNYLYINFQDSRALEYIVSLANDVFEKRYSILSSHGKSIERLNNYLNHIGKSYKPLLKIPLNKIVYYQEKGDIKYTEQVYGSSYVYGYNNSEDGRTFGQGDISSVTKEHDNRYVQLCYIDEYNKSIQFSLPYMSYSFFNTYIGDKEYDKVRLNRKETANKKSNSYSENNTNTGSNYNKQTTLDNLDMIKKLKELLDIGAITQEEFDTKKKQLLGL